MHEICILTERKRPTTDEHVLWLLSAQPSCNTGNDQKHAFFICFDTLLLQKNLYFMIIWVRLHFAEHFPLSVHYQAGALVSVFSSLIWLWHKFSISWEQPLRAAHK